MANDQINDGFIKASKTLTDGELGLEGKKIDKQFHEKVVDHLFSATFLVFLLVVIMVGAGIGLLWGGRAFAEVTEYWKWIIPIVTTFIGYAIGNNQSDRSGD